MLNDLDYEALCDFLFASCQASLFIGLKSFSASSEKSWQCFEHLKSVASETFDWAFYLCKVLAFERVSLFELVVYLENQVEE